MNVITAPKIRIVESLTEERESLGLLKTSKMTAYLIYVRGWSDGGLR